MGVGFAKANEVADAIRKVERLLVRTSLLSNSKGQRFPTKFLPTGTELGFSKARKEGTGIIAGSKVRAVLEVSGVKDVVAKSLGSSNPLTRYVQRSSTFNLEIDKRHLMQGSSCMKLSELQDTHRKLNEESV